MSVVKYVKRHAVKLAFLAPLALVGCNDGSQICQAPNVLQGMKTTFLDPQRPEQNELVAKAYLEEVKVIGSDKSTKTTDCEGRFIVPTDAGPLDTSVQYRVGHKESSNEPVMMYRKSTDEIDEFYRLLEKVADRLSSQK
ncbi:hypothetical protein ACI2KR_08200 [Pseudomonas luteola]